MSDNVDGSDRQGVRRTQHGVISIVSFTCLSSEAGNLSRSDNTRRRSLTLRNKLLQNVLSIFIGSLGRDG